MYIKKFNEHQLTGSSYLQKIGDVFNATCPKCNIQMTEKQHEVGAVGSMYHQCPDCDCIIEA